MALEPTSHYIDINNNTFHFLQYGSGKPLLIAFHGFYQHASSFEKLFISLSTHYTVISIDLPHHGKSIFREKYWDSSAVFSLIEKIQAKYSCTSYSLWGYSIGGRVILSVLPAIINKVQFLFLAAADGFYMDMYYKLATRNVIGKRVFSAVIQHRNRLIHLADLLHKIKLLPERTLRFAKKNIENDAVFDTVKVAWPCLSRLVPDKAAIDRIFPKIKSNTIIITGKYDAVINPQPAIEFACRHQVQYHILDTGHDFTKPNIQLEISAIILEHAVTL